MHGWAVSALRAAVAVAETEIARDSGRQGGADRTGRRTDSTDTGALTLDLQAICRHPVVLHLLQLLCGVVEVLRRRGEDGLAARDQEQQVTRVLSLFIIFSLHRIWIPSSLLPHALSTALTHCSPSSSNSLPCAPPPCNHPQLKSFLITHPPRDCERVFYPELTPLKADPCAPHPGSDLP